MTNKTKVKKISIALGVAGVTSIAGGALASCGAASSLTYESSVQLVVSDNSSTLADQSFSETSYNGIRDFYKSVYKETLPLANDPSLSVNNGVWKRPGTIDDSRINTYRQIKNDGSFVAVATGFNQESALNRILDNAALYNEFKDFGFIFVDGVITKKNGTNISAITFQTESAAFLTGIAAGVLVNKNSNFFKTTKVGDVDTYGIGAYVGLPIPSTISFLNGFRMGAIFFNQYIQPRVEGFKKLSWVSSNAADNNGNRDTLPADKSDSFNATEQRATTITNQLLQNGASLIYPIAGPQTALSQNVILSNRNTHHAQLIGVDTAQENLATTQPLQGAPGGKTIAFSTVKALDVAVDSTLKAIQKGQPVNGFYGYGWNNLATLANGGVSLSSAGLAYLPNLTDLFTKTSTPATADQTTPRQEMSDQSSDQSSGTPAMTGTMNGQTNGGTESMMAMSMMMAEAGASTAPNMPATSSTPAATTTNKQISANDLVTTTEANKTMVIMQYVNILAGTSTLLPAASRENWKIKGDELRMFKTSVEADAKLLPILTTDVDPNTALSHKSAIISGSFQQAEGTLLSQAGKQFVFKKLN
ncbi:BMP family lipoprotein [Mycoplasmoides gallisepticum]|uniref:BMP family lipoprotein n=1 Tax=Mycoplasmoides gallisepticum TaxID=2096 RepID=UPI001246EE72|nr:BMP family ABC transporter substrate-binding protein [Mycoplasmoides gallisepticum]QEX46136.1 BMP family ABC transporter substrate-binding protein [Mycoplasmoides gallisepticum]